MTALFISDLHLCAERPQKLELFKRLLRGPAKKVESLYILGDLFETWIGDDDVTQPHKEIISELANYSRSGHIFYIMRGNRDYLISRQFGEKTGGHLLNDETLITLNGERILLMHGDTLCTEDVKYQVFRRVVNNVVARKFFMCLPYNLRMKIWHNVRNEAKKSAENSSGYLKDVYQPTVEKVMMKYDTLRLIHGHTHRQAIHEFELNGKNATRTVLGDWIEGDSILVANEKDFRFVGVEEYLSEG